MNDAQKMIEAYKEEATAIYKSFAAHCDPGYVEAVAKQIAQRKLRLVIRTFNEKYMGDVFEDDEGIL